MRAAEPPTDGLPPNVSVPKKYSLSYFYHLALNSLFYRRTYQYDTLSLKETETFTNANVRNKNDSSPVKTNPSNLISSVLAESPSSKDTISFRKCFLDTFASSVGHSLPNICINPCANLESIPLISSLDPVVQQDEKEQRSSLLCTKDFYNSDNENVIDRGSFPMKEHLKQTCHQNKSDQIIESKKIQTSENEELTNIESNSSDVYNFFLLVFLYLFQGIPLGLTFGSIPFILKSLSESSGASYSDLGLLSLVGYPYAVKILWSPIVDSFYWVRFGRRKSWIFPMQVLIALFLFWMGMKTEEWIYSDNPNIKMLTFSSLVLVLLCATQDIAVDGWALTILSKKNLAFGSVAQTIGVNLGYFLSFTIFLALNSSHFCNKYIRNEPSIVGLVSLNGYMLFWSGACMFMSLLLLLFKNEPLEVESKEDIRMAYLKIWKLLRLPYMKNLISILLLRSFGFLASHILSPLKLIEKGFPKEDLAFISLIEFPFQMWIGFIIVRWFSGQKLLKPWIFSTYFSYILVLLTILFVRYFPSEGLTTGYYFLFLILTACESVISTAAVTSQGAFFSMISDPMIGGTYMTFLNTINNLGNIWPQYFVFKLVDIFTVSKCVLKNGAIYTGNHGCSTEIGKELCHRINGHCEILIDGYYVMTGSCFIIGLLLMLFYIHPQMKLVQTYSNAKFWKSSQS